MTAPTYCARCGEIEAVRSGPWWICPHCHGALDDVAPPPPPSLSRQQELAEARRILEGVGGTQRERIDYLAARLKRGWRHAEHLVLDLDEEAKNG